MPACKIIAASILLAYAMQTTLATPVVMPTTGTDDSEWVPAQIIHKRLASDPVVFWERDDSKHSLSGLAGCLKTAQPEWPQKQVTKAQSDKCMQQFQKRDDPVPEAFEARDIPDLDDRDISDLDQRDIPGPNDRDVSDLDQRDSGVAASAAPITNGQYTLSTICSTLSTVLSDFVTDGDVMNKGKGKNDAPSDLASQICDAAMTVGGAYVSNAGIATSNAINVQAGHKKGLSIVHANRKLQVLSTLTNFAFDLAKPTIYKQLHDMCTAQLVNQGLTCTTPLSYGAFEQKKDNVLKPMTGKWYDGNKLNALFDFSFAMPDSNVFDQ